jgi:hypothetical protein
VLFDWPELLVLAVQSLRLAWRWGRSRGWPSAPGTVQPAGVKPGWGFWAPAQYRSIFAYTFQANGSRYYIGLMAVEAGREGDALAMQKEMAGMGVTVRYDPENPYVSIVEERRILGRRFTQNPHWLP